MPRLNYTRRRTIDKRQVRLLVDARPGDEIRIRGHIVLEESSALPESASVQLYVCRSPYLRRTFVIGPVRPRVEVDLEIGTLPDANGLRADVRIVDVEDPSRRILAICSRCRLAGNADDDERRTGLLGVRRGDFDLPLWKVHLDELAGNGVWLEISRRVPDFRAFATRSEVQSLVIPEVVRRVAWKVLVEECFSDDPEEETPAARWVRWCFRLPGVGQFNGDAGREVRERWVDEIAEAFCRDCGLERRAAGFLACGDD
ncbi:MAG: hypothetical protein FJ257_12170 [Phycisphaerae bacterium]|nr:hypothetical protein [Phycisphaerae bacterium]